MKKKVIIGVLIAVVILAFAAVAVMKNEGSVTGLSGKRTYDIKAKRIEKGSISSYITASGAVEEVDRAEVYAGSNSKIKNILVEKYKKVTKGQKLADLEAAQNATVSGINIPGVQLSTSEPSQEDLTSPIDGVVVEINVREGSYGNTMQPAFVIMNLDKLQVKANIREFDIRSVAAGQNVTITGDAISKEDVVAGKVASVAPIAKRNITMGGGETSVEAIVSIDEKYASGLMPGINVTCNIETNEKTGIIVAGLDMFREDKDGNRTAFVVDTKTNTVKEKKVKTGIESDYNAEILEGLNEGDLVVIDPQPALKDGAKVKVSENK